MVNRKNTNIPQNIRVRGENEMSNQLLSTHHTSQREQPANEDVIRSLANAYENKRARQVSEWERVGFQTIYGN